jgi:alkylation response protein AidB-like acyl-CoA dehydrogenase
MTTARASTVVLAPEHEELRRAVRAFFDSVSPETAVRRVMATDDGFDTDVWRRASTELGLAGLLVPEDLGGSGFSFLELSVVLEEAGRALLPAPLLSTCVLATTALLTSADESAQRDYLPPIAAGELRATLALPGAGACLSATSTDGGWRLDGDVDFVLDGHTAQLLLLPAVIDGADALTLFAVDATANGLSRELLSTMDQTRKLARLTLERTPARLVGAANSADELLTHVARVAAIALACEQVGGAQKILEVTVDYVRARSQFGRAIGSFQAVKHRCADMLVDVEEARAVATHAAHVVAAGDDELPAIAAMAKAFCSDAYVSCAETSVQLHGGIGFTWEYIAHLHLKRAKSGQLLFGAPLHHRRVLGDLLGL